MIRDGCGACARYLAGDIVQCRNNLMQCYGLSHQLQGCQAGVYTVPAADSNAAPIPEGLSADQAVMLTDNLPTVWFGLKGTRIRPGDTVAVVGLGPIGLVGVEGAFAIGAARVFGVNLVPEYHAIAEALGAVALPLDAAPGVIAEVTRGRMADAALEAAGRTRPSPSRSRWSAVRVASRSSALTKRENSSSTWPWHFSRA